MNSLAYILLTSAKNSLKELRHKPGKLVMYLFIIALIVAMIVISIISATGPRADLGEFWPLHWFKGVYFLLLLMSYVISVQKGFTSGDTLFDLNDVNLLFVSPVNPRSTLLYGIVKLAKASFLAGFFILFQSSSLSNFGIGYGGVLLVFLTYILSMVVMSILSLVIYSVTNGRPRRKMAARVLAAIVFLPLVICIASQYFGGADLIILLERSIDSYYLNAIPFIGWTAAGTTAFLAGNLVGGFAWLGLLLLSAAGMIVFIMLSRSDYYEDVLVATETAFERKRAAEDGNINAASPSGRKTVKVSKTGISGAGASSMFYKHLRETFRENRFGFFSLSTIIISASIIFLSSILRGEIDLLLIAQVLMWIQVILIGTGRGLKETYSHYVYMIPASPFKKLVWSNLEIVFKTLLESVLFIVIPGFILSTNPVVILGVLLAYTLFALLLLGVNYFSMRFTQADVSSGLLVVFYFLSVVLVMLPGLIPALIVGTSIGGDIGAIIGLIILCVWELAAALVLLSLSKGILHNCDMPTLRTTK